ncbi:ArsR/SmtB family transcription factor [Devosia sp. RR2S18]|uniref:ArsR/SmtB family transcription factor n=1 Tax=Devosia rhizosphaerae TaxID=3049774 RepID=UPI00254262FE|nr:metalloregulator ArsR/SmtB family transcription factor [Devosia sp. RR2S18]WIJ23784.1 metalloregulator ArsR/SmtB family transcription factor [Devosia sp. RR2S18]
MSPVSLFNALADPTRCKIVEMLQEGPQPVHVLSAEFRISRPAISRHLRVLKSAKVIGLTKKGRENRYRLLPNRLTPAQQWLDKIMTPATPVPAPQIIIASTPEPAALAAKRAASKTIKEIKADPQSQMGFDF